MARLKASVLSPPTGHAGSVAVFPLAEVLCFARARSRGAPSLWSALLCAGLASFGAEPARGGAEVASFGVELRGRPERACAAKLNCGARRRGPKQAYAGRAALVPMQGQPGQPGQPGRAGAAKLNCGVRLGGQKQADAGPPPLPPPPGALR